MHQAKAISHFYIRKNDLQETERQDLIGLKKGVSKTC